MRCRSALSLIVAHLDNCSRHRYILSHNVIGYQNDSVWTHLGMSETFHQIITPTFIFLIHYLPAQWQQMQISMLANSGAITLIVCCTFKNNQ